MSLDPEDLRRSIASDATAGQRLEDLERWGEAGARLEFHKLTARIAGIVPSILPQLLRDLQTTITRAEARVGALEPPPSAAEMARAHKVLSVGARELGAAMRRVKAKHSTRVK